MGCTIHLLDGSTVVSDLDESFVRAQLEDTATSPYVGVRLTPINTGPADEDYVLVNPEYVTVVHPTPEPQEAPA